MLFHLIYSALLVAAVSSQGCGAVYDQCLVNNDQFYSSTCQPMVNQTMQTICQCYRYVNRKLCFSNCAQDVITSNAVVLQDFQNTQAFITSDCGAAGLNPNSPLPQPAPWQTTGFVSPSQSSVGNSPSATGASLPQSTSAQKSGGYEVATQFTPYILASLSGLVLVIPTFF